ncbi:MAG: hypothetical protein AAGF12_35945 [Myxococcota bacterium]
MLDGTSNRSATESRASVAMVLAHWWTGGPGMVATFRSLLHSERVRTQIVPIGLSGRLAACALLLSIALPVSSALPISGTALAQPESARSLFERAIEARQADELILAEELLSQSLELDPRSPTVFNLAEVRSRLGRYCDAVSLYRALGEGRYGELGEAQLREVRSRASLGEAHTALTAIVVSGSPTARLRIDTSAPRTVRADERTTVCLDEGEHVISASGAGLLVQEREVEIVAGSTPRVHFVLEPIPEADSSLLAEPWLWITVGLVVAAGATVAVGLVLGSSDDTVEDPVFGNKATLGGILFP